MSLFGKKKQPPQEGSIRAFSFELLGDDRDDKLTPYQFESIEILAKMECELEAMRRKGELIGRRFYGVAVTNTDPNSDLMYDEFMFEHPMEGIELIRRHAGREMKWFRLREDEGPDRFKPFEGEPAKYRITDK